MDLLEFGSALKNRRVAQQVSLTDIAAETRINIRFLEAIERGDFHVLPQTYVRAFLREYALIVDLPAEEVMRQYDEILGTPAQATAPHPEPSSVRIEASGLSRQQKRVLGVGGIIIVLLGID
ncbi:MAG: helix-turn-helix domain-containing protein, partial [Bacteroidetes bacterium]|nr:helix-turn-helix domain-containing protein [Bacteroidota bacterium]